MTEYPWLLFTDHDAELKALAKAERKRIDKKSKGTSSSSKDVSDVNSANMMNASSMYEPGSRQYAINEYAKCQQIILAHLHDLDSAVSNVRTLARKLRNRENISKADLTGNGNVAGSSSNGVAVTEKNPLHRYFQRMGYDWTCRFVDQCVQEREKCKLRNSYLEDRMRGPIVDDELQTAFASPVSGSPTSQLADRIAVKTEPLLADPRLGLEDKQLLQVKAGNQVLNEQLDGVSYKLGHLKTIASDLQLEVDAQNEFIPELQHETDLVHGQMDSATSRVERALKRLNRSYMPRYIVMSLILMGLLIWLFVLLIG